MTTFRDIVGEYNSLSKYSITLDNLHADYQDLMLDPNISYVNKERERERVARLEADFERKAIKFDTLVNKIYFSKEPEVYNLLYPSDLPKFRNWYSRVYSREPLFTSQEV